MTLIACVDVGSTYTKGVLVDSCLADPIVHTTSLLTTNPLAGTGPDVVVGLDQVVQELADYAGQPVATVLAASSAGGGLRIAVVGFESVVTAEAGKRAALCAGGKVVHVFAGRLGQMSLMMLEAAEPDLVLLVGGTNGGNSEVLLHNAAALAHLARQVPVVVAGNNVVASEAAALLENAGLGVCVADNVLPRIGTYEPSSARLATRASFLKHVIGGKGLSSSPRFAELVRGATPDIVFAGVELLADGSATTRGAGDVMVVDVGGATTDVYSVIHPEGEAQSIRREVVAPAWRLRTVEGDVGMRWSAPGVVNAAELEQLITAQEASELRPFAAKRADDPSNVRFAQDEPVVEARLAELAVLVAVRRHARPTAPAVVGRDLRKVRAIVGSGGVLRHAAGDASSAVRPVLSDYSGGWRVPRGASVSIDQQHRLLCAGLLAQDFPDVASKIVAVLAWDVPPAACELQHLPEEPQPS